MSELFHLGFDIDTSPLAATARSGDSAAAALLKVGDAAQKAAKDASAAASATAALGKEAKAAADHAAAHANNQGKAAASTKELEDRLKGLTGSLRGNLGEMQALLSVLRGGGGVGGMLGALDGASGLFAGLATKLGPAGMALGTVGVAAGTAYLAFDKLAVPLAKAADHMALLEARLKNSLGSTFAAKQSMDALFESTQKTGLGFGAASDAFARLARNNEAIGATRSELLQMSDTLQKLGAVSGASGSEISAGMLQLGQALASGRLQGDELRSIMENFPALAKAIAESLGVTIGQVRAMGSAGELTGDKVMKAILGASEKANRDFADLPDTVERSNQRIADSWSKLLAEMGRRWNASPLVTSVNNTINFLMQGALKGMAAPPVASQIDSVEKIIAGTYGGGSLAAGMANPQAARFVRQLTALRSQAQREFAEAQESTASDESAPGLALVKRGAAAAQDANQFAEQLKKAREQVNTIELAILSLRGHANDPSFVKKAGTDEASLQRDLVIAKAAVDSIINGAGLGKPQLALTDTQRAMAATGGGGAASMYMQALQMSREAQKTTGGSVDQFYGLLQADAAAKMRDDITSLDMQTEATKKLAAATGAARGEIREIEIANDRRMAAFQKGVPENSRVMDDYTASLRRNKVAADEAATAQVIYQTQVANARMRAQLGADQSQRGQARAGIEADINEEVRRRGMNAADEQKYRSGELTKFNLGNEMQNREATAELKRQADALALQANYVGLINDEWQVRLAMINKEMDLRKIGGDALVNSPTGQADIALAGANERSRIGIDKGRQSTSNVQAGVLQIESIDKQYRLLGLSTEEYRVQEAILRKEYDLRQRNVDLGSEQATAEKNIAEELERKTIAWEKARDQVNNIQRLFEDAGNGIKDVFTSSIDASFQYSLKTAGDVFGKGMSSIVRKLGAEMVYELAFKPFQQIAANLLKTFGSKFLDALGIPSAGGGGGYNNDAGISVGETSFAAKGNVYGFASGGAFTNSIVTSPTLFAFANGGRLGVMGEAGPEAVMPLRRGSDGKLGVSGGGGGDVAVTINDMRADTKAPQIQVAQTKGPDNRRVLQIMVRDAVKQAMRSGDLDVEMGASFGLSRTVARR